MGQAGPRACVRCVCAPVCALYRNLTLACKDHGPTCPVKADDLALVCKLYGDLACMSLIASKSATEALGVNPDEQLLK